MPSSAIYALTLLFGLTGAIAAFVLLVPESRRAELKHPFAVFLHNLFNFKILLIEKILKFFYVCSTFLAIFMGFFMLFWVEYDEYRGYYGLFVLFFMPIAVRLVYEGIMLFVLLVQNTIDINKKIEKPKNGASQTPAASAESKAPAAESKAPAAEPKAPAAEAPATPKVPTEPTKVPTAKFCKLCGYPLNENGQCTGCGAKQY